MASVAGKEPAIEPVAPAMQVGTYSSVPSADERQRAKILKQVVDELIASWNEWLESEDRGIPAESDLWKLVEDTLDLFATGMIPGECRRLQDLVDALTDPWLTYVDRVERFDIEDPPDKAFGIAMRDLEQYRTASRQPPPGPLPSIRDLLYRQKVSEKQVCEMYGEPFYYCELDSGGNLLSSEYHRERLQEELQHPGRHTGPGTGWMHPEARRRLKLAKKSTDAESRLMQRLISKQRKVAPESIEELIRGGVTMRQLCEMKGVTPDQVKAYCQHNGLAVPAANYEPIEHAHAPQEPELDEDQQRRLDSQFGNQVENYPTMQMTLEDFIWQSHSNGLAPEQIQELAEQSGYDRPHLATTKKIIRDHEKADEKAESQAGG